MKNIKHEYPIYIKDKNGPYGIEKINGKYVLFGTDDLLQIVGTFIESIESKSKNKE